MAIFKVNQNPKDMTSFSLLDQDTKNNFPLPKNTLKNTLIVAHSLLLAKTMNLNQAKDSVSQVRGKTDVTSHADYKFLTRFFDQGKITTESDKAHYEKLMESIQFLGWLILFQNNKSIKKKKIRYLTLDGTKWDMGTTTIHLLTLCILVGDAAIPIWWEDLEKAGHSSQEERITYVNAALEKYNLKGMILLADREYIGVEWFKHLNKMDICFVIRVKEGIYHDAVNGQKGLSWQQLKTRAEKKAQGKKISKKIILDGLELHYIILKNPRPNAEDELIFMVSNYTSATDAAWMYCLRWQIEVCFKHLKSNGLNLEKMHVEGKEKKHLMMAMAVLIYTIIIREGILEEYLHPEKIAYKTDARTGFKYRAVSLFRKGLSIISKTFSDLKDFIRYLKRIIKTDLNPIFGIV